MDGLSGELEKRLDPHRKLTYLHRTASARPSKPQFHILPLQRLMPWWGIV